MSLSGGTLTEGSDSLKSTSSRSHESEITQKNIDFTKDSSTAPLDIECNIQTERITKILDGLISQTKLALCIPSLVKESEILSNTLTPQHLADVLYITAQYETEHYASSVNMGGARINNCMNLELQHLLFIMESYPKMQETIDEIVAQMTAARVVDKNPGLDYLLTLVHFRALMIKQTTLTAADELKMKITVKKLEASNTSLIERIKRCNTSLSQELLDFECLMRQKNQVIARLEQENHWFSMEAGAKLKKQILDSDRQMVLASREHECKSKILEEEERENQNNYKLTLKEHLANEKNQRLRRFKVQTQLMSWIQKYDIDMTDKQGDYDEYLALYKEECIKLEKVEKIKAKQDIEYIPLMEERDAQYHEELTEKMKDYLLEHAARVIQVAWRTTLQNRAAKKKLKRIQKKLKADLEILERKRDLLAMKRAREARKQAKKNAKK